ncbi:MAG: para-aminobenzoate synthetase / 4-amino-4-deoxychorismate lyase [Acidobacteriota bacterium]|jgi:para-aminobenzoate synthetase/4-amino-4-deoxychorismate lyase
MSARFEVRLRTGAAREWLTFRDPTRVLRARTPDEVVAVLQEVERAVGADGCYAAGFVTYEAAAAFDLPVHSPEADGPPVVCFGLFSPRSVESETKLPPPGAYRTGDWTPTIDKGTYSDAIRRIKALIEAGETYQINFTFRLAAAFLGDPLALLRDLDAAQDGPCGAYVEDGQYAICSASPELLVRAHGDRIECRPMKGTAPRGLWAAADRAQRDELRSSPKNRAENVIVVDMTRNDLGRIARTGSVEAASLFEVERYPLQWQMASTVRARGSVRLAPLFEALFPSGSVTGAPKHRSMSIIRDLEAGPRGIYTGAIGYLSPHGERQFSVAIRTVAIDRQRESAEFGVGSGIVWDSVDDDEFEECRVKASILLDRPRFSYATGRRASFQLLETIGWTPSGGFALLSRHLERLADSAACFGFECDIPSVQALLDNAVGDLAAAAKLRVLVSQDGAIVCVGMHLNESSGRRLQIALATEPVERKDVFLYHKTTRRDVYDRARASRPDRDGVVLWNQDGEVTEGTEANIVVELDGIKVTPPIECGLLPGTFRAQLLADGTVIERRVTVAELRRADNIWLINSVRGWLSAELLE